MSSKRMAAAVIAVTLSVSLMAGCGNEIEKDDNAVSSKVQTSVSSKASDESSEAKPVDSKTESTPDEIEPPLDGDGYDNVKPDGDIKSAVLEEAGKLDSGFEFYEDFIFTGESDSAICCDYMGNKLADGNAVYVTEVGDTGYYAYYKKGTDIVYEGLIDSEGKELVSPDQKVGLFDAIDDRYLKAYFPEAETKNEEEAIYYVTSGMFSFKPEAGDTLYKGKIKVFDTKTGKFLENTAETFDPMYEAHGDLITYTNKNYKFMCINSEDKEVKLNKDYTFLGDSRLGFFDKEKTTVFDQSQKKLFTTNYTLTGFSETGKYIKAYDGKTSTYGIMDTDGKTLIKPKYKTILYLADGYFMYSNNDKFRYGIVKADGTELCKDEYETLAYTGVPYYFFGKNANGKFDLYDAGGNKLESDSSEMFDQPICKKTDDGYSYLVASDGKFSLGTKTELTDLGNYIGYDSKSQVLYDLVSGEKLMEGFEKAYKAYGHIYILKDGEITVYSVK